VAALEQELGVILFDRLGRNLTLTPSGLELLDHVRHMGQAAGRVSLSASGQAQSIEGSICITASEIYSAYLLPPVIAKLRKIAPGIEVEIVASNATVDLRRREADIAIRNARPTQSDLIARKLGDDTARLYAAASYLDNLGNPTTPAALNTADFIGFDSTTVIRDGLNKLGLALTDDNFPILTSNHLVQWELVKQGVGISVVPESVGEPEPLVRQALPSLAPLEFPIWLVTHQELKTSRRVRLVFDLLVQELAH
jgi:DNA-binding transcriptional LysR family regulator